MPIIYFTVTTDLSYDQRMIRICSSLTRAGYTIVLVGRRLKNSIALEDKCFRQKRIRCFFEKGKFSYAEYNVRLFFFLLFKNMNGICAIDLDTILPCFYVSKIKKIVRIYDAHELFCEMKEIKIRPGVYKFWKKIEQKTVPYFKNAYTVNEPIAAEFKKMYGNTFEVIRNIALFREQENAAGKEKYILYQGAVNEGRSFETLIPAMKYVKGKLLILGDGNFYAKAVNLVKKEMLEDKVIFKGKISPELLKTYTDHALIGITLFENNGLSNYFSLANRFFDYIQSYVPQLCVDYPVYNTINKKYEIAVLIDDLSKENIAKALNQLIENKEKWKTLNKNCMAAAKELNWQNEEKKLLNFYAKIFN